MAFGYRLNVFIVFVEYFFLKWYYMKEVSESGKI